MKTYPKLLLLFFISLQFLTLSAQFGAKNPIPVLVHPALNRPSESLLDCATEPTAGNCNLLRNADFATTNYDPYNFYDYTDPFGRNKINDWQPSHGSPTIYDGVVFNNPLPPAGIPNYFFAGVGQQGVQGGGGPYYSEGVVQRIPQLIPGHVYALSFFKAKQDYTSNPAVGTNNPVDFLHIRMIRCSDYMSTFDPTSFAYPPVPVNRQDVYCETAVANDNWEQVFVHFTATGNFNTIWIYPEENQTPWRFSGLYFSHPQLIDITNLQAQVVQGVQPGCLATLPKCGPANSVFYWEGPNGQTYTVPNGQAVTLDVTNPLNIGTWSLTLSVPGAVTTNNTCSVAGAVSASVTIDQCQQPAVWPKIYETYLNCPIGGSSALAKIICGNAANGNVFASIPGNMSNNIHHNGPIPPTAGCYVTQYGQTSGTTTWYKEDERIGFMLANGNLQMIQSTNPFNTVYRNPNTGALVSGPAVTIPSTEVILAEDNGTYITTTGSDLRVRSAAGTTITLPPSGGYQFPFQSKYNPVTKKLFVKYSKATNGVTSPDLIIVYNLDFATNALQTVQSFVPTGTIGFSTILQVNTNDILFLCSNMNIYQYDYTTNSYSLYTTSGLNNNGSIIPIPDGNWYVSDEIMANNQTDHYLYYINSITGQLKKIAHNSACQGCLWMNYYRNGNDIFVWGGFEGAYTLTIGSQTFSLPSPGAYAPNFVAKFNVQSDFNRAPSTGVSDNIVQAVPVKKEDKTTGFTASISPNPAHDRLDIRLTTLSPGSFSDRYTVSISNGFGVVLLSKDRQPAASAINISMLTRGVYYMTITNSKGEKITRTFIKE